MNDSFAVLAGSAVLSIAAVALPAASVHAQDAKSVAGTYAVVTQPVFGENPQGQLILGGDGRYSLILFRGDLPKVAAGPRDKGTAEENKSIVAGSIAHYGKYSVDAKAKTLTFNIEGGTYANWNGTAQTRALKVVGDQLSYNISAPSAGTVPVDAVWKRVK